LVELFPPKQWWTVAKEFAKAMVLQW
jgi:hypothetical protein